MATVRTAVRGHDEPLISRRVAFLCFAVIAVGILLVAGEDGLRWPGEAILAMAMIAGCGLVAAMLPALDAAMVDRPMERLIAFVGCDGSGKSTLTEDFRRTLGVSLPVRTCYLGLGSGAIGERIKRWPLIGAAIESRLARKAAVARTSGQKIPGLGTAVVIYLLSLVRLRRFKRMLKLRRSGFIILTDRYPQTECPGYYDGPGLSAATAGSWLVARLVERERRIYAWMATFTPDVVLRLNVDAETALARKPEHRADLIARKVAVTPELRFGGARIVDLDARLPYVTVRGLAASVVDDVLTRRPRAAAGSAPSGMRGIATMAR